MVVVDVEVHDGSDHQVFQQFFDDQPFAAGQTRVYSVSWPVPVGTPLGQYAVHVGVFDVAFETEFAYNSHAAEISIVTSAGPAPTATMDPGPGPGPDPAQCASRPRVETTARAIGGGRLEATVRAQTPLVGGQGNGLAQITFTLIRNATVQIGPGTASPGTTIPLGGTSSVVFIVTRQTASEPTTVSFTVRDACGDWPSFVGGGPGAF
jgi:hypothetical protein